MGRGIQEGGKALARIKGLRNSVANSSSVRYVWLELTVCERTDDSGKAGVGFVYQHHAGTNVMVNKQSQEISK